MINTPREAIDIVKAREITAGWIAMGSPNITAFATGHPGWVEGGLIAELEAEITYVYASPGHFDADESVKDLGTADQNIADLEAVIALVKSGDAR